MPRATGACLTAIATLFLACQHEEDTRPPGFAPGYVQLYPNGAPANARPGGAPMPMPGPTPPSPMPAPAPPPVAALRASWAVANEDPNDDYVVGPPAEIADCTTRLTALGVKTRASQQPVHKDGTKTCGSPQVVSYESGPGGARWSSSPQVTCLVAIALSRFETIVQEEAQRHFSSKVTRINHMGTYACRPMVRFNMASEHSFANAIDIGGFELQNGTRINVDPDWGVMTAPPSTPAARFLRTVARRTYDDGAFSVVLGPPWDELHKNHLHLDQARYRVDGLVVKNR